MWGVAYEIAKEDEEMVTVHLDHREKDGYNKLPVIFYPCNNVDVDSDNNMNAVPGKRSLLFGAFAFL